MPEGVGRVVGVVLRRRLEGQGRRGPVEGRDVAPAPDDEVWLDGQRRDLVASVEVVDVDIEFSGSASIDAGDSEVESRRGDVGGREVAARRGHAQDDGGARVSGGVGEVEGRGSGPAGSHVMAHRPRASPKNGVVGDGTPTSHSRRVRDVERSDTGDDGAGRIAVGDLANRHDALRRRHGGAAGNRDGVGRDADGLVGRASRRDDRGRAAGLEGHGVGDDGVGVPRDGGEDVEADGGGDSPASWVGVGLGTDAQCRQIPSLCGVAERDGARRDVHGIHCTTSAADAAARPIAEAGYGDAGAVDERRRPEERAAVEAGVAALDPNRVGVGDAAAARNRRGVRYVEARDCRDDGTRRVRVRHLGDADDTLGTSHRSAAGNRHRMGWHVQRVVGGGGIRNDGGRSTGLDAYGVGRRDVGGS